MAAPVDPTAQTATAFSTVAAGPSGYVWTWEGGPSTTKRVRVQVGTATLIVHIHPYAGGPVLGSAYLRDVDDSGTPLQDVVTLAHRNAVLDHLRTAFATEIAAATPVATTSGRAMADKVWRKDGGKDDGKGK
ncbi:hypothetical protein GXW82_16140 [Streptacidiphilus sp. 4-A2]|nr:hypothetical protein [Streptacidiphilus sp. 4-A2]